MTRRARLLPKVAPQPPRADAGARIGRLLSGYSPNATWQRSDTHHVVAPCRSGACQYWHKPGRAVSGTENLVRLKHFGPGNPEAARLVS